MPAEAVRGTPAGTWREAFNHGQSPITANRSADGIRSRLAKGEAPWAGPEQTVSRPEQTVTGRDEHHSRSKLSLN